MAMADTQERPTVEERYLAAANTSDLTIDADRASQADVILAAALSKGNQLGHALVFLRGQWDRSDKPAKRSAAWIVARAAQIRDKKGRPDVRKAAIEAMVWHASAMRERAAKLTGRAVVLGLLGEWAAREGVDADLLSPALFHWLAPSCPACGGTAKMHSAYRSPEAAAEKERQCEPCKGTGNWPRPHGAEVIHSHILRSYIDANKGTVRALYG